MLGENWVPGHIRSMVEDWSLYNRIDWLIFARLCRSGLFLRVYTAWSVFRWFLESRYSLRVSIGKECPMLISPCTTSTKDSQAIHSSHVCETSSPLTLFEYYPLCAPTTMRHYVFSTSSVLNRMWLCVIYLCRYDLFPSDFKLAGV